MNSEKRIKKIIDTPLYWVGDKVYCVQGNEIEIYSGGIQDQGDINLLKEFLNR